MSFDLSRIRFDARKDFLGVVMQQGRVQLDSDWNEWVAELARRIHAGAYDTLSGNAVPRTTPDGFRIEADGGGLTIGAGRIYVDGLLAENHGDSGAWDPHLAELAASAPIAYADQPYYPDAPGLPEGGPHLVYVDVWRRDVTPMQEPELIEEAVGVDTSGRHQTVWQVKVLADVGNITCATADDEIPGWAEITAPSAGRLSTSTGEPDFEPEPCDVPPAAGYRGRENQLYRVEVHTGGPQGTATFKWSRDNGTVASRVTHINPARDRITVESIGRDDVLRFHDGDWVEVTDDWREFHGLPGELRRIRVAGGVDETARTLEFDDPLTLGLFPTDVQQATETDRNTRVRRWDQSGQVRREDGTAVHDLDAPGASGEIEIPASGTRLFLDHGILVEFDLDPGDGEFKSGDHWAFAARTVGADIEILDRAPPLGIHHHYARLAVVTFPDEETDCRTLWPPVSDGGGCDCSVCVSAEGHNNGTATLQHAIDSIKDIGGTICLGVGSYDIGEPINVDGARSLRIRGQGMATVLVGSQPGGILDIAGSIGVALENLSVIGSAGGSATTAMIAVRNVVDFRAEHINVVGLASGGATSVGIAFAGYVLGASVFDSAVVAKRGLASADGADFLLTGELRAARNFFLCSQRAFSFEGTCYHYGQSRIEQNLMLNGDQAAIVVTGAVLPGSPMALADNVVYTEGDGVRAGVDGLAIERNEITGVGDESGNGIVLEEGLDPVAIDRAMITGNRILSLLGNGIAIVHRVENAIISENLIEDMGQGALVMAKGGAVADLRFAGNRCVRLGLAAASDNAAFAAVQLIDVERGDVLDNVISLVAQEVTIGPGICGLRAGAVGQLRIAGNRVFGIGSDGRIDFVDGIRLLPPFDRVAIDDNSIDRVARDDQELGLVGWRTIHIAPESDNDAVPYVFAANYVFGGGVGYLVTETRAAAVPERASVVSVRGNRLRGHATRVPLNLCVNVASCLFAENHCEVIGRVDTQAALGLLAAPALNASNNRLVAGDDMVNLRLQAEKQAVVIGNISTGGIQVDGGSPVPTDLALTNIFGV